MKSDPATMARGECDLAKTRPAAAQPHLENRGKAHDFFPFFFLTGGGDRLICFLVEGGGGGSSLTPIRNSFN